MYGHDIQKQNPADFLRDESVPRPPPFFAHVPSLPFDQEYPKPLVPDVSLIFSSPSVSSYANNSYGFRTTPLTNGQSKITSILKKSPAQFSETPSEYKIQTQRKATVQTPSPRVLTTIPSSPVSPPADSPLVQELIDLVKYQSLAIGKMQEQLDYIISIKDSCNSCNNRELSGCLPVTPSPISESNKKFAEKEVQVSLLGDLSFEQQFQCSMREERRASNHYHPCLAPTPEKSRSTETTLYGLSSKHLSFSTKQYLQRHGLVHSDGNAPLSPKFQGIGSGKSSPEESSYKDRILDITALKNQPKLT